MRGLPRSCGVQPLLVAGLTLGLFLQLHFSHFHQPPHDVVAAPRAPNAPDTTQGAGGDLLSDMIAEVSEFDSVKERLGQVQKVKATALRSAEHIRASLALIDPERTRAAIARRERETSELATTPRTPGCFDNNFNIADHRMCAAVYTAHMCCEARYSETCAKFCCAIDCPTLAPGATGPMHVRAILQSHACKPWACSCQGFSDRYEVQKGNWGSSPAEPDTVRQFWMKHKCATTPAPTEPGMTRPLPVMTTTLPVPSTTAVPATLPSGEKVEDAAARLIKEDSKVLISPGDPEVIADVDKETRADADAGDVEFCAIMPATSMNSYKRFMDVIAGTYGQSPMVRTYLFFNGDMDQDKSKMHSLCSELKQTGPGIRCLWLRTGCKRARFCTTAVIMTGLRAIGAAAISRCKWVIKLDTDVIFLPKSTARFVREIGTDLGSQRMFFGTLSAKLIYSGRPHLWIRTQMPQGNWMVNRPVMMTMMNHIANGTCYMPYMGYTATDEAAVSMCAWFANAVDCITSWQDFAIIGPAGSELQNAYKNHIDKIHKGPTDCYMLIHKFVTDEGIEMYNRIDSQDHDARICPQEGLQRSIHHNGTTKRWGNYSRQIVTAYKWRNQSTIDLEPTGCAGNARPINVPDRRLEAWVVHQTDVYLQVNPAIDKMDHEQEAVYKRLKPEKGVMNHWGML